MTEPNGTGTITGAAASVAKQALTSLPAQFLILCLINVVFVLGLIWFLQARAAANERIFTHIMDACFNIEASRTVEGK